MSDFVFEEGEAIDTGQHGEHDFVYANGEEVVDTGRSDLAFEEGTGLGGLWQTLANIPESTSEVMGVVEDSDTLHIFGGDPTYKDHYIYDRPSDSWSEGGTLNIEHESSPTAAYGGYIWCIGLDGEGDRTGIERWDGSSWSVVSEDPPNNIDYDNRPSVQNGSKVLVTGGGSSEDEGETYVYNLDSDSWDQVATCPINYRDTSFAMWDGDAYIVGGRNEGDDDVGEDSLYKYDFGADSWSSVSTAPVKRNGPQVATSEDGYLYLIGGNDPDGNKSDEVYRYDIDGGGGWEQRESLPEPRSGTPFVDSQPGEGIHVVGGNPGEGEADSYFYGNV